MARKKTYHNISRGVLEQQEIKKIKQQIAMALDNLLLGDNKISRSLLCQRLQTSLPQLHRLLDPKNYSVTLLTLVRTAQVAGKKIEFNLVDLE